MTKFDGKSNVRVLVWLAKFVFYSNVFGFFMLSADVTQELAADVAQERYFQIIMVLALALYTCNFSLNVRCENCRRLWFTDREIHGFVFAKMHLSDWLKASRIRIEKQCPKCGLERR